MHHRAEILRRRLPSRVKAVYIDLLPDYPRFEIAESFFNSVYCRLFKHRDLTPDKLFVFSSQPERRFRDIPRPLARDFTPHGDLPAMLRSVLSDLPLRLLWEDLTRDIRYITQALQRAFSAQQLAGATFQIANELFYRNKAAWLVGAAPGRRRLSVLAAYPPQRIGRAVYRRLPDR